MPMGIARGNSGLGPPRARLLSASRAATPMRSRPGACASPPRGNLLAPPRTLWTQNRGEIAAGVLDEAIEPEGEVDGEAEGEAITANHIDGSPFLSPISKGMHMRRIPIIDLSEAHTGGLSARQAVAREIDNAGAPRRYALRACDGAPRGPF